VSVPAPSFTVNGTTIKAKFTLRHDKSFSYQAAEISRETICLPPDFQSALRKISIAGGSILILDFNTLSRPLRILTGGFHLPVKRQRFLACGRGKIKHRRFTGKDNPQKMGRAWPANPRSRIW
jgi:hypothetical protein